MDSHVEYVICHCLFTRLSIHLDTQHVQCTPGSPTKLGFHVQLHIGHRLDLFWLWQRDTYIAFEVLIADHGLFMNCFFRRIMSWSGHLEPDHGHSKNGYILARRRLEMSWMACVQSIPRSNPLFGAQSARRPGRELLLPRKRPSCAGSSVPQSCGHVPPPELCRRAL